MIQLPSARIFLLASIAALSLPLFSNVSIELLTILFFTGLFISVASYFSQRLPHFQTLAISVTIFLFGAWWFSLYKNNRMSHQLSTSFDSFAIVALNHPQEKNKVVQFDATIISGDASNSLLHVSLLKDSAQNFKSIKTGSALAVYTSLQPLSTTDSIYGDYYRMLFSHGYDASVFVVYDNWCKLNIGSVPLPLKHRIRLRANMLRDNILAIISKSGVTDNALNMSSAMAFGDRSLLSSSQRKVFSQAGVAHVLALSGMHISIIFMLLCFFVRFRRFSMLREAVIIFVIWCYVLVVGMPISALRAAIMLSISMLLSMSKSNTIALNSVSVAGVVLFVANPLCVVDVGFQFSFISVISILIMYKTFYGLLLSASNRHFPRLVSVVWSLVSVSLAAQLGTVPLQLYYFGSVSLLFIPANFIAIPSAYAIILSTLLIIIFSFFPFLSFLRQAFAVALSAVVDFLDYSLRLLSSLPFNGIVVVSCFSVVFPFYLL